MTDNNTSSMDKAQDTPPASYKDIRNISYFILTIAAIFIINAMETGSYRTPWPIAIGTAILGAGLFIYAQLRKRKEKP